MTQILTPTHETAIWTRLLEPKKATLPAAAAKFILDLDFSLGDKERIKTLAAKARQGNLSPEEQDEIDTYGRVGGLLSILKSKARVSLRKAPRSNGSGR